MPKRKIAERRQKHALGEDKISYLPLGEGVSVGEGFFIKKITPSPKYFEWGRSLHASLFRCHAAPKRCGSELELATQTHPSQPHEVAS